MEILVEEILQEAKGEAEGNVKARAHHQTTNLQHVHLRIRKRSYSIQPIHPSQILCISKEGMQSHPQDLQLPERSFQCGHQEDLMVAVEVVVDSVQEETKRLLTLST